MQQERRNAIRIRANIIRWSVKLLGTASLLLAVSACSTELLQADEPLDPTCAAVARARAEDVRLMGWGRDDQRNTANDTYSNCLFWKTKAKFIDMTARAH